MNQITMQKIMEGISQLNPQQPDFVSRFEDGLAQLATQDESETFGPLVSLFDDQAAFDEPMFSIIRLIERSDTQTYVSRLLGELGGFVKASPRWASIVVMRVLNSDPDAQELAKQVAGADQETRDALAWLLNAINKRGDTFKAKTEPLLDLLETA